MKWILLSGTLSGILATFAFYGQTLLSHAGWSLAGIGVLCGVENGLGAFMSASAQKIVKRLGERRTVVFSGLGAVVGLLSFAWLPGLSAGSVFLVNSMAGNLADPIIDQGLNRIVPSEQRATLLSFNILMTTGVGELLAGFMSSWVRRFIHEGQDGKWYVGLASLVGMSYVFIAVSPSVATVFVASFIGSIITGLLYVIYASTMQRTIPAEIMGRFQTVMSGLSSALTGGGSMMAGVLNAGPWGFGISACLLWICAMMSMLLVRA